MNRPPHAPPLSTRYHNCVRLAPGISSETGRSEWHKNRSVSRIMRKEISWRLSTVPCIAVCAMAAMAAMGVRAARNDDLWTLDIGIGFLGETRGGGAAGRATNV